MDWQQVGHVLYIFGRDFYRSAHPYFGYVFVAIVCLAILAFLHSMYARNLRDTLKWLVHEMESASRGSREPSSLNFLFAVFLVVMFLLIVIGGETSDAVREFFLREAYDPHMVAARMVIATLLILSLLVFFIWSISLSAKYRREP
jgi:uncharacterized BrkB/YihY/UPF0761 family membrane protein